MYQAPIFRDRFEVTDVDMQRLVDQIIKMGDDIVVYGIQPGRRFVGFSVSNSTSTSVLVDNGLLWFDGGRFYDLTPGGATLDLIRLKPDLQKRTISIVAYPSTKPDLIEERDQETDATTGTVVPQQVETVTTRGCRIEAVPGAEAASPQPPVVANAVVLATVEMGTDGITSIKRNTDGVLVSVDDLDLRLSSAEGLIEDIAPKIATLSSEISSITSRLDKIGNQELAYALAQQVAAIDYKLGLPAAYVRDRADFFLDETHSDLTALNYTAKCEEGLRFAPDAIAETQLSLANPYDPSVTVSGDGLVLPLYDQIVSRVVKGGVGELKLAQYAFELRSTTILSMTRARARYGREFELSTGSAFWLSGTFLGTSNPQYPGDTAQYASVFKLNSGETFQVYQTGRTDPDGYQIVRLSNFWTDSLSTPYWSRVGDPNDILGFAWNETFLQPRGAWCVGIAPRVYNKPNDGVLQVGLSETINGQPDLTRMLCNYSKPATFWTTVGPLGSNKVDINPVFLEGGSRKNLVLMTSADYSVQQVETGATVGLTGTMFYGLNGGVWQSDPARHIMFDLYYATFNQNRVEVQMAPLSLPGGIAAIDITAEMIVPEGTSASWEIQLAGKWLSLDEGSASLLATLPPLLPLRLVLTGTSDAMPGIRLSGSRVRVSRPKTIVHHVSEVATLGTASSTIKITTKLRNFLGPAHHTHGVKILVGAGYATVETPDAVNDVVRGSVIERTSTFMLAAPATSYKRVIDETTDSPSLLFICDQAVDVAL